jgi:hypothetical protein
MTPAPVPDELAELVAPVVVDVLALPPVPAALVVAPVEVLADPPVPVVPDVVVSEPQAKRATAEVAMKAR